MTTLFKVGDKVRLARLDGISHLGIDRRPVRNSVYTVVETMVDMRLGLLLKVHPAEKKGWFSSQNFDLWFERKTPARSWVDYVTEKWEVVRQALIDAKAIKLGEGPAEAVKRLLAEREDTRKELDVMRAWLEPLAKSTETGGEKPLGTLARILAEHKWLDRQMFLANSYNWSRLGLTWETAARDLFNYIQTALNKPALPYGAPLLPSLVGKDSFAKGGTVEEMVRKVNTSLAQGKDAEVIAGALKPIEGKFSKVIFGDFAKLFLGGEEFKPTFDFVLSYKPKPSYPPEGKRWDYYRGWVDDWLWTTRAYPPFRRSGSYDIRLENIQVVDKVEPRPFPYPKYRWCDQCQTYHNF